MKTKEKVYKEKVSFPDYDGNMHTYEVSYTEGMIKWWKKFALKEGPYLKLDEEFLRLRDMKNKE